MLKLLRRKKVAKRIFYVLAAIIIPAFVIWGSASSIDKNKTPNYAGVIFGKKVSFDDFRQALFAWNTQLKLQYGEKANEIAAAFFNPTQAAWERLILLHEAKRRGLKATNPEIIATLTNMPFLQKNNNFDPQAYGLFLRYSLNMQPRAFEEQLRENLSMAKLFKEVTEGVTISDEEIKQEYEKINVQTRVKYVFFPVKGYKDKVSITEDGTQAYYERSKEKFKVPPQINVSYCGAEFKEESSEDEKTKIKERLTKAYALAKAKGLAAAAKEENLEVKETGLFGFEDPIPGLGWMPQLSNVLFDLPAGNLSKVVETPRGAYIFMVKEKKDAYIPAYAEAKDKAKDALLNERSKEIALNNAEKFLNSIKTKSMSFEKAAQESDLTIKETPLFAHEGYISELGLAQPLKDAAFKLAKDAAHESPIELEQGYYDIKSIETIPFDEEKFKKEKDDFSKQLLETKRNKVFNDFSENLKKQARLINFVPDTKTKQ
ncbi:MAG: SurA N-terminal domain-containing protein [Candidatus Omnitrophota bacterium]